MTAPPSPTLSLWFPVAFAGMWLFVGAILAELSGWPKLARRFPGGPRPKAKRLRGQVLRMGMVSENNITSLVVAPQGLYLYSNPLFRFRRPPILVPWSRVQSAGEGGHFWWRVNLLDLDGVTMIGVKRPAYEAIKPFVN